MSLTPSEIEVIEAVANALQSGPVHSDYRSWCCHLASELRKLLPQPESLEEAAEKMLMRVNASVGCGCSAVPLDDLRDLNAALARRRKEQGK